MTNDESERRALLFIRHSGLVIDSSFWFRHSDFDLDTMKRVKRRLLNALAVLSLILCGTTIGMWAVDGELCTQWTRPDPSAKVHKEDFLLLGNRLTWSWYQRKVSLRDPLREPSFGCYWLKERNEARRPHLSFEPNHIEFFGFGIHHSPPIQPNFHTLTIPSWFLALAFAILPTLRGRQLLRSARRRNENLCPQCGYDLRATPDRCPECGNRRMKAEG